MTPTAPPPPPVLDRPSDRGRRSLWRRPAIRSAWIVLGSLFTVGALAWGALEAVGWIARGETTESHSWAAADVATIVIHNEAGEVHVTRGDGPDVELTSHIERGLFDTDHSERLVGDRLELRGECPELVNHYCRVDLDLTVPDGIAVEIRTQQGTTSVTGIDAPVSVRSDHGRVELARLGGPLDLRVRHGSLSGIGLRSSDVVAVAEHGRMDLAFAEAPTSVRVSNQFGSIDLVLPDDGTAYAVTSASSFGRVDNQLHVDSQSPHLIDVSVEFGRASLGYAG